MRLILINVSRRQGKAKETGNPYDMTQAVFLTGNARTQTSATMSFESSGFGQLECAVDPTFYPTLKRYFDENSKGAPVSVDVEMVLGTPNRVVGFVPKV